MKSLNFHVICYAMVLLFLCGSCEYHNNDVFFREVDSNPELPDLKIDLNLSADTIYVYKWSNIKLQLSLTNKTLYGVKFFVDNQEYNDVSQVSKGNYQFTLSLMDRKIARVRVEIYTSTGTGSIADKVQAEQYFVKTQDWILIYEPNEPELKHEVVDGRLKISWTPVKSRVKAKYAVTTSNKTDSTFNNWYIDSTYTGGANHISVQYKDKGISGYAIYQDIHYQYPKLAVNNTDSFMISWNRYRFFNSIRGIRVKVDNRIFDVAPQDSFIVFKAGVMGHAYDIRLELVYKKPDNNNNLYFIVANTWKYYQLSMLYEYANYTADFFPLTGNSMYYWANLENKQHLFRFSLSTKSAEAVVATGVNKTVISPNCNYLICEENDKLSVRNPGSLELIKSIPKSKFNIFNSASIGVSDNGIAVVCDYTRGSMLVCDIPGESVLAEIPVWGYIDKCRLSANGKYVFIERLNKLFQISNSSAYSVLWNLEGQPQKYFYADFFPDNPEKIALYDGENFVIKLCSDFSTVISFPLKKAKVINVDFEYGKILCYNSNVYYVYSLSDGKLLHTVPTEDYGTSGTTRIFGNYIFYWKTQLNLNSL